MKILKDKQKCWCKSGKLYADCHKNFDLHLLELAKQGNIIPPHSLIKNSTQIEGIREAGRINTLVLDKVASVIHEGMTTDEIDKIVFDECVKRNAYPSPLNYYFFPKSVCTYLS